MTASGVMVCLLFFWFSSALLGSMTGFLCCFLLQSTGGVGQLQPNIGCIPIVARAKINRSIILVDNVSAAEIAGSSLILCQVKPNIVDSNLQLTSLLLSIKKLFV